LSFFSKQDQIIYCIENQQEGNNFGKHNFIYEENFGITCKFCFLPKQKANYKPIVKGADNKFHLLEKTEDNKQYFFEVEN